ncbi:MAG: helix-turn-helix transcriptional regulator, partial [Burkholderiaceae bacterium]|nr:helix-turn-helix transcriptional regulator [Burkholderiaceae bacterium]
MTNINSRLREWRTFRKLTQEGLAALLGTHVGMVRKYEGGHAIPGGNVLAALAKDGLDINWLLTGEGWMIHDAPKPAAGNDEWRQRMASGRVHWEGNNPAEKAVYWWLMESTRDSLELPWLPRSISLDECQRLVKTAAALLDSVAQHNEGRLVELLLHPEIFGEALHLAFWSLKPLDGAT